MGTGNAYDEDTPLSDIIGVLNERFGSGFKEQAILFFEQTKERAPGDQRIVQTAEANPSENRELLVLR